jgi:hypothetical protein
MADGLGKLAELLLNLRKILRLNLVQLTYKTLPVTENHLSPIV